MGVNILQLQFAAIRRQHANEAKGGFCMYVDWPSTDLWRNKLHLLT